MIAYFDTFSGASGDMIVAALLDAGVDFERFRTELAKLPLDGFKLEAAKVQKNSIAATKFNVHVHEHKHGEHHHHPHRNLHDITSLIDASGLSSNVKGMANKIFRRLAEAEAAVHGKPVGEVHFHEVGAVDSIIDIVGAALALEMLGVQKIFSGPLRFGSGTVECQHGVLPLPAPATARLAESFPVEFTGIKGELTTPTGAAILTTVADFSTPPSMNVTATGFGAGTADRPERANVLRVIIGKECASSLDRVVILQANIDDMTGEQFGFAAEALFAAGALDVFFTPAQMKKMRPGTLLTAIAKPERREALMEVMFRETTTFGVRWHEEPRVTLERRFDEIELHGMKVRIKLGLLDGKVVSASPEYEDCAKVAREKNLPLREIYIKAQAKFRAAE